MPRLVWLVVAAALLLWPLGLGVPIQDSDEAIYGEVAREMVEHSDWVATAGNYVGWFGHPVVSIWVVAGAFKVFGVHAWAARIPAALEVLALAWLTWWFTRRHHGERAAALAVMCFVTLPGVSLMGHNVKTDLNLILAMSLTIVLGALAPARPVLWLATGACAGLGMLTKGPIGLLLPGAVVLFALLWERRELKALVKSWPWMLPGVGALLLVWLPWNLAMYRIHGWYFVQVEYLWSTFQRFSSDNLTGETTPLYFLHTLLWAAAPAIPSVLAALWLRRRDLSGQWSKPSFSVLELVWILVPLVVLSSSRNKLPHYIFPIFPPMCALAGAGLLRAGELHPLLQRLLKAGLAFMAAVGVVAAGVMMVPLFPPEEGLGWLLFLLLAVVVVTPLVVWSWNRSWEGLLAAACLGMVVGAATHNGLVRPQLSAWSPAWMVAEKMAQEGVPVHGETKLLALTDEQRFSIPFASDGVAFEWFDDNTWQQRVGPEGRYLLLRVDQLGDVKKAGLHYRTLGTAASFPTSRFSIPFSFLETRHAQETLVLLIKAWREPAVSP